MPIYEFYCPDCHTIFSFLSRRGSRKRPDCPRCGRPKLERRASSFAISKGRPEPTPGEDGLPDVDDAGMERAMESLAREAEGISEDDPRAMARLMRRFYQTSGMPLGDGMEEAIQRMEAGEDPEQIEEELGDLLEDEEALLGGKKSGLKRLRGRMRPPRVDDTLYEL
jgi:putative FmdB family regulatory protein